MIDLHKSKRCKTSIHFKTNEEKIIYMNKKLILNGEEVYLPSVKKELSLIDKIKVSGGEVGN